MLQSRCQKQEDLPVDNIAGNRKNIDTSGTKLNNLKDDARELFHNEEKDGVNSFSESLTLDEQAENTLLPMDLSEDSAKPGKQKENLLTTENKKDWESSHWEGLPLHWLNSCGERSTEDWFFQSFARKLSAYFSKQIAKARNRDPVELLFEYVVNAIVLLYSYLLKYEREICLFWGVYLIWYGGSYPILAAILAGCEISGMKQTLWEGYRIGKKLTENPQNTEIATGEIKELVKEAGLQFSWLLAMWNFPIWAEVCVIVVLISRLSLTFPIVRMLRERTFKQKLDIRDEDPLPEIRWLPLIGSGFLAFIFMRIFPCLVTGLYMGHIGIYNLILTDFDKATTKANVQDFSVIKQVFLKNESTTRSYVWGILLVISLWQASRSNGDTFFSFCSMVSALARGQVICP